MNDAKPKDTPIRPGVAEALTYKAACTKLAMSPTWLATLWQAMTPSDHATAFHALLREPSFRDLLVRCLVWHGDQGGELRDIIRQENATIFYARQQAAERLNALLTTLATDPPDDPAILNQEE